MNWDLLDEHETAYSEEQCKRINELTDLFDVIFDYMNRGWALDVCVDVFPCTENPAVEIPKCIQKYYDMYVGETYRDDMKKKFDIIFSTEKKKEGSIADILKDEFNLTTEKHWDGTMEQHQKNIDFVAKKLIKETGVTDVTMYALSSKDLSVLKREYMGILFSGDYFQCGNYAVMILVGTTE